MQPTLLAIYAPLCRAISDAMLGIHSLASSPPLHCTAQAIPHLAVDPVLASAQIVTSLQSLVSRETSPTSSAVLSVTRFNTGPGAPNVIPDAVELQGTTRALTVAQQQRLRARVEEVVTLVAGAHGCNVTVEWSPVPYIPTVNDAELASFALGMQCVV